LKRIEFVTAGSPLVASRAIEECARSQGNVTAIVVPWESDGNTLSMAITAVRGDGWAIEHTNMGTVQLTGWEGDRTKVTIVAEPGNHPDPQRFAAVFDGFVRRLQRQFRTEPGETGEPGEP
jgi:hypothetical protein